MTIPLPRDPIGKRSRFEAYEYKRKRKREAEAKRRVRMKTEAQKTAPTSS